MTTPYGKKFPFHSSRFSRLSSRAESGFSLLEISVVLALISLVTVMAVTSGIAVIASTRQSATVQKMATIDNALMAFRTTYDRLPCPGSLTIASGATNYGAEAGSPSASANSTAKAGGGIWDTCIGSTLQSNLYSLNSGNSAVAMVEGGIPTVALGLPNDFMYDGWGKHIRYAVDSSMTQPGTFTSMPVGAKCSAITVCDSGGYNAGTGSCVNSPRTTSAVYALMSHGANQFGGILPSGKPTFVTSNSNLNPNELQNCHATGGICASLSGTPANFTPVYVQQDPGYPVGFPAFVGNPAYYFDDIVTYKERWQMAIAWDRQGSACPQLWVFDTGDSVIYELDMNGNYINSNNTSSPADSGFGNGNSGAVDMNGNVWVSDPQSNRIMEFSGTPTMQWLMTIGGGASTSGNSAANCSGYATSQTTAAPLPGTIGYCGQNQASCICNASAVNGRLNSPRSNAIDNSGNIWVADTLNNRIQKFSNTGVWLLTIGPTYTDGVLRSPPLSNPGTCNATPTCPTGTGNGEFNGPIKVTTDPSGNVWVADSGNNRIQKFTSSGKWLLTIGGGAACTHCVSTSACTCVTGTGNGLFTLLRGIISDVNGNIWAVDYINLTVQEFNNNGTFITSFTIPQAPNDIAVDANGNLWVIWNFTLHKYSNINGVWTSQPIGAAPALTEAEYITISR